MDTAVEVAVVPTVLAVVEVVADIPEHQDISLSQLATICGVPHQLMYLKK